MQARSPHGKPATTIKPGQRLRPLAAMVSSRAEWAWKGLRKEPAHPFASANSLYFRQNPGVSRTSAE